MSAAPDLTVVVLAYRSEPTIGGCLSSLPSGAQRPSADPLTFEAVVVDNASPDGSVAAAIRAMPGARVERLPANLGFAAGVNAGLALARGRWVLLLNPDAHVAPGGLSALVDFAERHRDHRLYGGRTLTPEGAVDPRSCFGLPSLWSLLCYSVGLTTLGRGNRLLDPESLGRWPRDTVRPVGALSGCFLLADTGFLRSIGGLDPAYFMYSEDIDLAVRARAAGADPVFVPQAVAVHDAGGSSTSVDKAVMVLRGKSTFLRRHWSPPRASLGVALLQAGVLLRAGLSVPARGRGAKWRAAWTRRAEWVPGW